MTLLTALREHKDVQGARKAYESSVMELFKRLYGNKYVGDEHFADKDNALVDYDRALVTACLQEAAKRIRGYALGMGSLERREQNGLMSAADFVERMGDE